MFCANVWIGNLDVKSVGRGGYAAEGTIYVENVSYNKVVGIHFYFDGKWQDMNATYSGSLVTQGGNRVEVWTVNQFVPFTSSVPSHIQYAVYYHNVDWQVSYWDNNGGSDYFVPVTP